jgi:hypothetical protein
MRSYHGVASAALAMTVLALLWAPARATTLVRQGLESLVKENRDIVLGQVQEIHSAWNADHSFILTDVRVRPTRLLKGDRTSRDVTFTVMGGTVGDITTLIVGGPEIVPGSEYLFFLSHEDLPGASGRNTIRELMQGVFDVVDTPSGKRAISQAAQHPLLPDASGLSDPPGGDAGLPLQSMIDQVGRLAGNR